MNTLGGVYYAKTGKPTNNDGKTYNLNLSSGGGHSHNGQVTSYPSNHSHSLGSNNITCGRNAGDKVPGTNLTSNSGNNHGIFQTDKAGLHKHNVDVAYNNENHIHSITGFNNEATRPHTVSIHYIIKYK